MDIREAKEQIKYCVSIYLQKDAYGQYRIPVEKQRPVFLLGAPGIGKTAIMEQVAQETGLPLVSYSMTHHTRQSALGLPVIREREFQGQTYSVSEYTLSEIITSLYECMERTGSREGILFLDEINCVSETLAPSMLQFLQYKTFGNHPIPAGWVIVTAGNPPQYNRAVREFDIVTLDRLKVLEIEPDLIAWQQYAREKGIHRAIQSYLDVRREDFYRIETTKTGREYVTARGWEDLSEAITLYEESGYPAGPSLIGQYIRHSQVADAFATYYALYCKYREAYPIREMLDAVMPEMVERARLAPLDERITLLELLLEALVPSIRSFMHSDRALRIVKDQLQRFKADQLHTIAGLENAIQETEARKLAGDRNATVGRDERESAADALVFLKDCRKSLQLEEIAEGPAAFDHLRNRYMTRVRDHQEVQRTIDHQLTTLFDFVEKSWGNDHEMLVLVSELTANRDSMAYLYVYGSRAYDTYSERGQLAERREAISRAVSEYMSVGDVEL